LTAKQRSDEQVAKVLFDACSVLRGTPLKLVQVLATERELLPKAYREQFALAAHQVEPIGRALVGKVLRVELGDPKAHFRQFDDVPFAAASLGQVHAATTLRGDAVAVKLQYPGVGDGIDSDLRLVKAVLGTTQWGELFESCYVELRERLNEELDYRCEAANTEWFRTHVRLSDVLIPRIYAECTTKRVIVTERFIGRHISEYLATGPTQAARNHYGQVLVDLFHHSVYELSRIHADPNFGNYLFSDDGRLRLIDFGCVRRLEPAFVETTRHLFTRQTFDGITAEQLHSALGVAYRTDVDKHELHDFLLRWGDWLFEPYRNKIVDFARSDDYFERGAELGENASRFLGHYEGAFLYFWRAYHGLQRLLQTLGATVHLRLPNPD
jgi:predicted unusual protein kinase regulating ubiquinone biosynthesis (AarF/ABC1/UbiB family)